MYLLALHVIQESHEHQILVGVPRLEMVPKTFQIKTLSHTDRTDKTTFGS